MIPFSIQIGDTPIVTAAIHDGHFIRKELYPYLALQEHERFREEDPYTDFLTEISDTRIQVNTSRFEVDLNRPRHKAIYQQPEDAWGLKVWNSPLSEELIAKSRNIYDQFYTQLEMLLISVVQRFGYFVVLDFHSYNHKRDSFFIEAPQQLNPDINVGTIDLHNRWKETKKHFLSTLRQTSILNRYPDVRENIKFKGGYFTHWINKHFGQYGCSFAIEFKKNFMEEWTGRVDIHHIQKLKSILNDTQVSLRKYIENFLHEHID